MRGVIPSFTVKYRSQTNRVLGWQLYYSCTFTINEFVLDMSEVAVLLIYLFILNAWITTNHLNIYRFASLLVLNIFTEYEL